MAASHPKTIKNVAIVGAGGQIGKYITTALLSTGKHTITALTRGDGGSSLPDDIHQITKVDYSNPSTIVSALKGQDLFIITMSVFAPPNTAEILLRAAAEAGVPYVIPNGFGIATDDEQVGKDVILGPAFKATTALAESLGLTWIAIGCGFWYEFSLCGGIDRYGFDFKNKKVKFLQQGKEKMNTSTFDQVGRGVAALLSLPVGDSPEQAGLERWKNTYVKFSSFCLSQRDMFESILRVTGGKESDWTIEYDTAKNAWEEGMEQMKKGDRAGFGKVLYSRMWFEDQPGDFESEKVNAVLGLPEEDLDERTAVAIKMAEEEYMEKQYATGLGKIHVAEN